MSMENRHSPSKSPQGAVREELYLPEEEELAEFGVVVTEERRAVLEEQRRALMAEERRANLMFPTLTEAQGRPRESLRKRRGGLPKKKKPEASTSAAPAQEEPQALLPAAAPDDVAESPSSSQQTEQSSVTDGSSDAKPEKMVQLPVSTNMPQDENE
ncbi:nuclear factor Y, partial [Striga asiatica]